MRTNKSHGGTRARLRKRPRTCALLSSRKIRHARLNLIFQSLEVAGAKFSNDWKSRSAARRKSYSLRGSALHFVDGKLNVFYGAAVRENGNLTVVDVEKFCLGDDAATDGVGMRGNDFFLVVADFKRRVVFPAAVVQFDLADEHRASIGLGNVAQLDLNQRARWNGFAGRKLHAPGDAARPRGHRQHRTHDQNNLK